MKMIVTCPLCGGQEVTPLANVNWSVEQQAFVIQDVFSKAYCGTCEGEVEWKETIVPDADDNSDVDDSTPCPTCGSNTCDSPYVTGCDPERDRRAHSQIMDIAAGYGD
jgi:hypothetical protein